ncbi:MAG: 30S ribosomal protein S21 [Aureispira sp.]
MLIINVKDGESIDRALRRYKNKHKKVQLMKQLRGRKHFTKPSVERRVEILKAKYNTEKLRDMEG